MTGRYGGLARGSSWEGHGGQNGVRVKYNSVDQIHTA